MMHGRLTHRAPHTSETSEQIKTRSAFFRSLWTALAADALRFLVRDDLLSLLHELHERGVRERSATAL